MLQGSHFVKLWKAPLRILRLRFKFENTASVTDIQDDRSASFILKLGLHNFINGAHSGWRLVQIKIIKVRSTQISKYIGSDI